MTQKSLNKFDPLVSMFILCWWLWLETVYLLILFLYSMRRCYACNGHLQYYFLQSGQVVLANPQSIFLRCPWKSPNPPAIKPVNSGLIQSIPPNIHNGGHRQFNWATLGPSALSAYLPCSYPHTPPSKNGIHLVFDQKLSTIKSNIAIYPLNRQNGWAYSKDI